MTRPHVVIAMAYIRHYRLPFYERLRDALDDRGIDLTVLQGEPSGARTSHTRDFQPIPGAVPVRNRILHAAGKELWWQPILGAVRGADLVVVEQASSRLVNYVLLGWQAVGGPPLALWGHGVDFRPDEYAAVGEAIKRWVTRRVHWMFTYNQMTVDIVNRIGLPRTRITDVRNAIDSQELIAAADAVSDEELAALRADLGIDGDHVGVFIGAMHKDKRLPFLLEAAEHVRTQVPDFHLVLIGDGDEAVHARAADDRHPWVHWVGQQLGVDRVRYLELGDVQLMPGTVGLAVLDSFATVVPMISSTTGRHAPEIAYLETGRNGVVVDDDADPEVYGRVVADTITDPALLDRLRAGCREDRARYTIEEMVRRFADGVEAALAASVPRLLRRAW